MAGHSRWAQVKHKKAGTDQKRGMLFSKLARMISVAAREGGGDPGMNTKLRQTVERARDLGLPKDNIERAVARGVGADAAENLRAVEYEAYGPGGVAYLIAGLTDNPNRTTNEVKHLLDEGGGRLAMAGSVSWLFERKMLFEFDAPTENREELELALIDAGAEDMNFYDATAEALVRIDAAERFRSALAARGVPARHSGVAAIPKSAVRVPKEDAVSARALAETLENHEDITAVWFNLADDA